MPVLVIISFAMIAILNIPGMVSRKYWKELIVFSILLLLGFGLSLLMALGVELPYIAQIIIRIFKSILKIKD